MNPRNKKIVDFIKSKKGKFTRRQVAKKFHVTVAVVDNLVSRYGLQGFLVPVERGGRIGVDALLQEAEMAKMTNKEVSALVRQESRADAAERAKTDVERKLKVLKRDYHELEKKLGEFIEYEERAKRPINILPTKGGPANEISPQILFSDWHAEELVDPRTIGGKNKYNLDIARKRAENVTKNAVKRMRELSDEGAINTVGLYLLGDFITGHIHDENVETAQLGRLDALQFAEELLLGSIEYLLRETDYKYVVYCKVGNHSRMTQKVRAATEWQNSVEPLMYWSLKRTLEANHGERVRFHLEPSYMSVVNVLGTKVRYHHGHSVSYGGGVGGLSIPLNKAIKGWNENEKAHVDVLGHFHSALTNSTFKHIVNGSLIGYNAYAERIRAASEPPLQMMFVVHKKYGVVRLMPLYAE